MNHTIHVFLIIMKSTKLDVTLREIGVNSLFSSEIREICMKMDRIIKESYNEKL